MLLMQCCPSHQKQTIIVISTVRDACEHFLLISAAVYHQMLTKWWQSVITGHISNHPAYICKCTCIIPLVNLAFKLRRQRMNINRTLSGDVLFLVKFAHKSNGIFDARYYSTRIRLNLRWAKIVFKGYFLDWLWWGFYGRVLCDLPCSSPCDSCFFPTQETPEALRQPATHTQTQSHETKIKT